MTAATAPPQRAWVEQIMGLPISVHVRGPDVGSVVGSGRADHAEERVAALFADLRRADEIFSTYRSDSQLNRWERAASWRWPTPTRPWRRCLRCASRRGRARRATSTRERCPT